MNSYYFRVIAIKDIITAAKTVHHTQMDELHSLLGALIDEVEAVCPVLVTNSSYLPSTFRVPTFVPHSLAPDKSYPEFPIVSKIISFFSLWHSGLGYS